MRAMRSELTDIVVSSYEGYLHLITLDHIRKAVHHHAYEDILTVYSRLTYGNHGIFKENSCSYLWSDWHLLDSYYDLRRAQIYWWSGQDTCHLTFLHTHITFFFKRSWFIYQLIYLLSPASDMSILFSKLYITFALMLYNSSLPYI